MKLLRVAILALLYLAEGAVVSYSVTFWAACQMEERLLGRYPHEELSAPFEWPMTMPEEFPSFGQLKGDPAPSLWRESNTGTDFLLYRASYQSDFLWIDEWRRGWPARSSSSFEVGIIRTVNGSTTFISPELSRWSRGLHLLDRPMVWSNGKVSGTLFPVWFPLRPIWSGLLINSTLYGTILFTLTLGVRQLARAMRVQAGLCPHCRYPIGTSPVCTECGMPVPDQTRARERGAE